MISNDLFQQLGPYQAPTDTPAAAAAGNAPPDPSNVDATTYIANKLKSGLASGVAGYTMVYRGMLATLDPLGVLGLNKYGEAATQSVYKLVADKLGVKDDLTTENALVRNVAGPMVEGIGAVATMPAGFGNAKLLTTVEKNLFLGAGMGEGAHIGKMLFGGVGEWLGKLYGNLTGGDADAAAAAGRQAGEAIGGMAGGAAGGAANVVRGNAMVELPKAAYNATKATVTSVKPAYDMARQAQAAGDTRGVWQIFSENMGPLRAQAMTMMQDVADQNLANVLRRDIQRESMVSEFDNATKQVGVNPDNVFTLGQRTANPILLQKEQNAPMTGAQAGAAAATQANRRAVIAGAYKKIVDNAFDVTPQGIQDGIDAYRLETMGKVNELGFKASRTADTVASFSNSDLADRGANVKALATTEKVTADQTAARMYQTAYDAATADKASIDLAPLAKTTKGILDTLISDVDPNSVPRSVKQLNALLNRKADAAEAGKEALELDAANPFYTRPSQAPAEQPVTLKDVNDVMKSMMGDQQSAWMAYERSRSPSDYNRAMNLKEMGNALLDTVQTQLGKQSPTALDAFESARAWYRDNYAPRFKVGTNNNLFREAGSSNRNQDYISDEKVMDSYLQKGDMVDRMNQFDALFGGKYQGSQLNRGAYYELNDALENRYHKEVLDGGYTPEKHYKFTQDYSAALQRVPETANKLTGVANTMDRLNMQRDALVDTYKDVVGSGVSGQIGAMQARQLFIQALGDPTKMERLLASPIANTQAKAQAIAHDMMLQANPLKDGMYDPEALNKLLTTGASTSRDGVSSFEMLMRKALGSNEAAAEHIRNLKAISVLTQRDAMLDPKYLRFSDASASPVKDATGSSTASLLSGLRSWSLGYGGVFYFPMVVSGRFINNAVQKALQDAELRALTDPEMSNAVLKLAREPASSGKINISVLQKVLGAKLGTWVHENLLEKGNVGGLAGRGAIYGSESKER